MPDIANENVPVLRRLYPFRPIATSRGCLYCPHGVADHEGLVQPVRIEGRRNRKFVLHALFCRACATDKDTSQVACWQMPERVYRNFNKYGVEV